MKFFEKFGRDIQLEIPQNRPMKDESKKKEEKKLQNKKSWIKILELGNSI